MRPYFHLMRSFIDGHGGSSSNELIQVGRNGFAKRYAYERTRNNGIRRNLKARIYDCGAPIERDKARDHSKVEMSEEIQRLNSKLDGMGIMLKGKEEQIRRAKPRSKLRVYLP